MFMRKMKIFTTIGVSVVLVVLLFAFTTPKKTNPVGVWNFTALNAPAEYQKGKMIITKPKAYACVLKFDSYPDYELKASNVVVKKNKVSFQVYVENENTSIELVIEGDNMSGKVNTSQGEMPITAVREQSTK